MTTEAQAARLRVTTRDLARIIETIDVITRRTYSFTTSEFDKSMSIAREAVLASLGHIHYMSADLAVQGAEEERRREEAK